MPAVLRWTILVCVLMVVAPISAPARAELGNCADPAYLSRFDSRLAELSFDCVERLRVTVSTASGERVIRIIHNRDATVLIGETELAEFDRAVRAAPGAIAQLGNIQLEDVTLLLVDGVPPDDDPFADTHGEIPASTDILNDGECRIVLYLLSSGAGRRMAATVTAHEIFHCVQAANLTQEQMNSGGAGTGAGGDWWLEGSAEWFAAVALPDAGLLPNDVDTFDRLSPTTPLNRLAYSASVFFLWLGAEDGADRIVPFLQGMASSSSESAQRAAMSRIGQDRWLDFAQAYLDREIRHPHGTELGFDPEQGEIWEWSATQTRTAPLEPFILHRGVLAFQCGRWSTSAQPNAMHSARVEDGGDWADLPRSIDTTSGSGGSYAYVAVNAGSSRVTLSVEGRMDAGCGDCMGVITTDACLYGTWQLTGGGAIEWMRSQGVPITSSQMSNATMTFFPDGTFLSGDVQTRMRTETPRRRADSRGNVQGGGRWSTNEGVLNICGDMLRFSGQVTMTDRRGSRTMDVPPPPGPGNMSQRYTCSGNTLSNEIAIPGHPPVRSQYTRVSD